MRESGQRRVARAFDTVLDEVEHRLAILVGVQLQVPYVP